MEDFKIENCDSDLRSASLDSMRHCLGEQGRGIPLKSKLVSPVWDEMQHGV